MIAQMENVRLEPGTILADKYRLEGVLGVGGMGTVYRAEHLALKAPVAIKVIDREISEGDVTMARFMREAQAAAALRSPHVVQILDYGTEGDRPFMVMEMLEGEPLSNRIERYGKLTPAETYRVINHIAKAVARAHEAEIVHRDLKPDNVFLVHNEGDEIAKVLDFGVAKVEATQLDGSGHTRTGSLLGTPYYMSPEQAQGNKDIDARSDLWALGVIAFECLTGKRPFSSDGLGDLVLQICIRDIPVPSKFADIPETFDLWFEKACAREPGERFQTARELAESLFTALQLDQAMAVAESRWSRAIGSKEREDASVRDSLSHDSTSPDLSERYDNRPSERPTRARDEDRLSQRDTSGPQSTVTLALETRLDDDQDPPSWGSSPRASSKWEVVPHQTEGQPALDRESEPLAPIPKKGGGATLAFVALLALMVGGAAVFGVRAAGILEENRTARPRPGFIPEAPEVDPTQKQAGEDQGSTNPEPGPSAALRPGSKAASKTRVEEEPSEEEKELDAMGKEIEAALENPEEDVVAPGEGDDVEQGDEQPAEAKADSQEPSNSTKTPEGDRPKEPAPSAPTKGPKPEPVEPAEDEPEPTLPDHLLPKPAPQPAPAPPAPAPEPAPQAP